VDTSAATPAGADAHAYTVMITYACMMCVCACMQAAH
jgi:hypothetical protein